MIKRVARNVWATPLPLTPEHRQRGPALEGLESTRVCISNWVTADISIYVDPTGEANGVLLGKPPCSRIVVPGTIEMEAGFRIEFPGGVGVRIGECAALDLDLPVGIIDIRLHHHAYAVAKYTVSIRALNIIQIVLHSQNHEISSWH